MPPIWGHRIQEVAQCDGRKGKQKSSSKLRGSERDCAFPDRESQSLFWRVGQAVPDACKYVVKRKMRRFRHQLSARSVKVSPPKLSSDAVALKRFQREDRGGPTEMTRPDPMGFPQPGGRKIDFHRAYDAPEGEDKK
jgi:hypothetical protein